MENVYLGFTIDNKLFGITADAVIRVSQIVEITSVPKSPRVIKGIINVMGEIVPVVDIRYQLNFPEREFRLSDYLIIFRALGKTLSFVVDGILGLIPGLIDHDVPLNTIIGDSPLIERVIKHGDGFIMIVNPQKILSLKEGKSIENLIDGQNEHVFQKYAQISA